MDRYKVQNSLLELLEELDFLREHLVTLAETIEKLEKRVKALENNSYPNGGTYNDTERH